MRIFFASWQRICHLSHSKFQPKHADKGLSCQVIGEVTELFVDNIDQHPYHHHVQPYQIVAMDNDTDDMNAWWRVSRLLPF